MLGLLIKDFLALKKYAKTLLTIFSIYAIWSYIENDATLLISFTTFIFVMITITSLAYDEQCNWFQYAKTMPFNQKTIVLSKYALGFLLCTVGITLSTTTALLISIMNHSFPAIIKTLFVISINVFMLGLLFVSIYLPFVFQFGAEKSRMIAISIVLLPTLLITILSKIAPNILNTILNAFSMIETNPIALLIAMFFLIVIIIATSFSISIQIFKKKEF